MENKDYVTYAQAKKLKELGFNWEVDFYYYKGDCADDEVWVYPTSQGENCNVNGHGRERKISRPSLWEAQKWLREGKGIAVYVIPRFRNGYEVAAKELRKCIIDTHYLFDLWDSTKPYPTYELALSSGISAALEILGK